MSRMQTLIKDGLALIAEIQALSLKMAVYTGKNPNEDNWINSFEESIALIEDEEIILEKVKIDFQGKPRWEVHSCKRIMGEFHCSGCDKSWKSYNSIVEFIFYYDLDKECGIIKMMKEFGQSCRRCYGPFIRPSFNCVETDKAMEKLILMIRRRYYDSPEDSDDIRSVSSRSTTVMVNSGSDGTANPRFPHERSCCEACLLGRCSLSYSENSVRPQPSSVEKSNPTPPTRLRGKKKIEWKLVFNDEQEHIGLQTP